MIPISSQLSDTVIHIEEKKLRYCEDEGTLPDLALVHGRLLVQAWEQGRLFIKEDMILLALRRSSEISALS